MRPEQIHAMSVEVPDLEGAMGTRNADRRDRMRVVLGQDERLARRNVGGGRSSARGEQQQRGGGERASQVGLRRTVGKSGGP